MDTTPYRPASRRIRRKLIAWLLIIATSLAIGMSAPRPALATGIPVLDSLVNAGTQMTNVLTQFGHALWKLLDQLKEEKHHIAATAFKAGAKFFVKQLAHDTAVWIASGGKGQQPLFVTQGWGAYLQDVGDAAVGSMMDELTKQPQNIPGQCACTDNSGVQSSRQAANEAQCTSFNGPTLQCKWTPPGPSGGGILSSPYLMGFNVCDPYASVGLRINLGLSPFTQPRPKCRMSKLIANWEQAIQRASFLPDFQTTFEPAENPLGIALIINDRSIAASTTAKENAKNERQEGQGFLALKDPVTGDIKTPGSVIKNYLEENVIGKPTQPELTFVDDLLANAIDVFTNTLAGNLLKNVLQKGLGGGSSGGRRNVASNVTLNNPEAEVTTSGVQAAELRFAQDINPNLGTPGSLNVLSELVSCSKPDTPGPNNCAITNNMQTAISQRLTVKEAVNKGLFNADGSFGFASGEPRPTEARLSDGGIPYRTILLLRKYRIVPVGWELAARYIEYFDKNQYSLRQLMALYDVPPTIDNDYNPFYHLVDQSWVFVAPDAYCKLKGSGPEIVSKQVIAGVDTNKDGKYDGPDERPPQIELLRNENYCADEQTCINKDAKGICQFYGYCTEEQRTWNFGNNACDARYNTCTALANKESGESVAYLLNTVDFNGCTQQAAGCRQYSQNRSPNLSAVSDPTLRWRSQSGDLIHLNAQAGSCEAADAGCRAYIRTGLNLPPEDVPGVNLLQNPSFEAAPVSGAVPGWSQDIPLTTPMPSSVLQTVPPDGIDGSNYLHLGSPMAAVQQVDLKIPVGGLTFTLSYSARNASGGNLDVAIGNSPIVPSPDNVLTNQWKRYTATKTMPQGMTGTRVLIVIGAPFGAPNGTEIDAVKLELGAAATAYTPYGVGTSSNVTVRLKRAPDYLGCQPSVSADQNPPEPEKPACQPYARFCMPEEAGCLRYTPTLGGAPITSVRGDSCPTACVGYDTYTQSATFFEQMKFADFIPKTAKKCTASAVGCDEFTNLDKEAQGGEAREYYQQVRYCQKPGGGDDGTFYTWEGSDTTGFQLRVFQLKKTTAAAEPGAPCVSLDWTAPNTAVCADTTASRLAAGTCSPADLGPNPDCRQFYDPNGNISYRLLSKTISVADNCRPYRKTESTSADCAQSNGYWDSSLSACLYQVVPDQGRRCNAVAAGCREYRGGASANYRVLFRDTFESGTDGWSGGQLSAVSSTVGGHSYALVGPAAAPPATKTISVTTGNFISNAVYFLSFWAKRQSVGAATMITVTSDNLHSFCNGAPYCPGDVNGDGNIDAADVAAFPSALPINCSSTTPCPPGADVNGDGVVNAADQTLLELKVGKNNSPPYSPPYEIGRFTFTDDNWPLQPYQTDPVRSTSNTSATITITVDYPPAPGPVYLDNIELRSNINTYNLIKGSSAVPSECTDPVSVLGCQPFTVSDGATRTIWQFGPSCGDKAVGCEAVIDTQNSTLGPDAPFAKTFTDDNEVEAVVPADAVDFVVNDPAKSCHSEAQGCSALGVPVRAGPTDDITGWRGVCSNNQSRACVKDADCENGGTCSDNPAYLLNDPDRYGTTLCRPTQRECSIYTMANNQANNHELYFKNPGSKVCEYRADVPVPGWYRRGNVCLKDGVTPCVSDADCPGGGECGLPKAPNCEIPQPQTPLTLAPGVVSPTPGFVGLCPTEQSSCTEFIDPRSDSGRSYLYNGSFYLDADGDQMPDGWQEKVVPGGGLPKKAYNPDKGVRVASGPVAALANPPLDGLITTQPVSLHYNELYTLSADVTAGTDANGVPDETAPAFIGVRNCRVTSGAPQMCRNADPDSDGVQVTEIIQARSYAQQGCPPAPQTCVGDLNGDGQVTIDEITMMVKFSLEGFGTACQATTLSSPDRSTLQFDYSICKGGSNNGGRCTAAADCPAGSCQVDIGLGTFAQPSLVCKGGSNNGGRCTAAADCPAGSCQVDPEHPARFSGRFYSTMPFGQSTDDTYTCDVIIGTHAEASKNKGTGHWFRNVSLRKTGLYYQLADKIDRTSCNGLVDNSAGCVLFNERRIDPDRLVASKRVLSYPAVKADADASRSGSPPSAAASGPPEFGTCSQTSPNDPKIKLCDYPISRTCLVDSDCALPFDATDGVIKVTPDRQCSAWLSCRTARTVTTGGVTKQLCLDVQGCEALDDKGTCKSTVLNDVADRDLGYNQATVDRMQDRSGYSKVGFDWLGRCTAGQVGELCQTNSACDSPSTPGDGRCGPRRILQGYMSPAFMRQNNAYVEVLNGDFESASASGAPANWYGWNDGQNFRVINNPVEAQKVGIEYPLEGRNFLEVNANHPIPLTTTSVCSNDLSRTCSASSPCSGSAVCGLQPAGNVSNSIPVINNTTYIISAYLNTLHFTGKSAEVRVYEYPNGTTTGWLYNATLNLGPGFGWTLLSDKFTTRSDTQSIRLQFAWDPEDGSGLGNWYIDDLKIQPALQYQKNENQQKHCMYAPDTKCTGPSDCQLGALLDVGPCVPDYLAPDFPQKSYERGLETLDYHYAPQSCRLYPENNALSCRYYDDKGLRHTGKRGYCLEWDPQNANYCLQWWPVDSVLGEDTGDERGGYDDRAPLYYCLDTMDGYVPLYDLFIQPPAPPSSFGLLQSFCSAYDSSSKRLSCQYATGGGCEQVPYIMMSKANPPAATLVLDVTSPNVGNGYAAYGLVDKGGPGTCTSIDHSGCEVEINFVNHNGGRHADVYVSNDPDPSGTKYQLGVTYTETSADCYTGNPNTSNFNTYYDINDVTKAGNNIKGPFRYLIITGDIPGIYRIYVRPVYSCNSVVETVTPTGDNKAYASRLTRGSAYTLPISSSLTYVRDTDLAPFGGAVPPQPVDSPDLWDTKSDSGLQPLFPEPPLPPDPQQPAIGPNGQSRAGAPYSCALTTLPPVLPILNYTITPPDQPTDCSTYLGVINTSPQPPQSPPDALRILNKLFVESYGIWEWSGICQGGTNNGQQCVAASDCLGGGTCGQYHYQTTGRIGNLAPPSQLCNRNDRSQGPDPCAIAPQVPKILLNNAASDVTVDNIGAVTLSFTAVADPDQEPISSYLIDWGDGSPYTLQSGLRLQSRPSTQNAIALVHIYNYADVARCFKDPKCPSKSQITQQTAQNGKTYYSIKPRLQITDNWGWCNGDFTTPSDASCTSVSPSEPLKCHIGYYNAAPSGTQNCDPATSAPWRISDAAIAISGP